VPLTAVTTPFAGACSVVQPTVCIAVITWICAWATDAWAASRSAGCSCALALFVAIVVASWFCADVT
jgi:hypothetical protein